MKKDNAFLIIPTFFNLCTIILFFPAYILGSVQILQYIWICLALVITVPDMFMSFKLFKKNDKNKTFALINFIIAACFFVLSVGILIYVLVTK